MNLPLDVLERIRAGTYQFPRQFKTSPIDDGFLVQRVTPCSCRLHGTRVTGIVTFLKERYTRTCCGAPYDEQR